MGRKRGFLPAFLILLPLGALFLGGRPPLEPDSLEEVPAFPLDLNRAPAGRLSLLPGFGPVRSARIVEERRRGGPFRSLEDLAGRVPGLGPALIRRAAPFLKTLPTRGRGGR